MIDEIELIPIGITTGIIFGFKHGNKRKEKVFKLIF